MKMCRLQQLIFLAINFINLAVAAHIEISSVQQQPPQSQQQLQPKQQQQQLCSTEACDRIAGLIAESLNTSADPCDNFYRFTCGEWIERHPIPEWKAKIGIIEQVEDEQADMMRHLLERYDLTQIVTGLNESHDNDVDHDHQIDDNANDDGGNKLTSNRHRSAVTSLAAYVYQNCMSIVDRENTIGLRHLREMMRMILGGREWRAGLRHQSSSLLSPSLSPSSSNLEQEEDDGDDRVNNADDDHEYDYSWHEAYVNVVTLGAVKPIFDLSIDSDPKNVSNKLICFSPAEMDLSADDRNNATIVAAYRQYMIDVVRVLRCGGEEENGTTKSEIEDCDHAAIQSDIDEIRDFETKLAAIQSQQQQSHDDNNTDYDPRDVEKVYHKMRFDNFSAQTKFDWLEKVLQPIWQKFGLPAQNFTPQTEIIVIDVDYFEKAIPILAQTETRIIENYFGWIAMSGYSALSIEPFRNAEFRFARATLGVAALSNRSRTCFRFIRYAFSWPLSRLLVEQGRQFGSRERASAEQLIDEIQRAFRRLLQRSTWLDDESRRGSIAKLDRITKLIAFPAWLTADDGARFDRKLSFENRSEILRLLQNENYLLSYVRVFARFTRQELLEIETATAAAADNKNFYKWTLSPFSVNAAYMPDQNSIIIPVGQLSAQFFDPDYPAAINFGNIGATVGHEFAHALDDDGRKYDAMGNLRNWWTKNAIERFDNRSECFVRQYAAQREPITGLCLNGHSTLGENIADNVGLREAFAAFRAHQNDPKSSSSARLAALPQFSPEQLFFIAYGYSWCGSMRDAAIRSMITEDPHVPASFRVNIPVSNLPEFANAFRCAPQAAMNPDYRCRLW